MGEKSRDVLEDAFYQKIEDVQEAVIGVKDRVQIVGSCIDDESLQALIKELYVIESRLQDLGN